MQVFRVVTAPAPDLTKLRSVLPLLAERAEWLLATSETSHALYDSVRQSPWVEAEGNPFNPFLFDTWLSPCPCHSPRHMFVDGSICFPCNARKHTP